MARKVALVAAIMSAVALFPLPYGYYMLLRVVVCGAGIYCGVLGYSSNREISVALFVVAAIFNPVFPVHLFRELWALLNLAAVALFGYYAWRVRPRGAL